MAGKHQIKVDFPFGAVSTSLKAPEGDPTHCSENACTKAVSYLIKSYSKSSTVFIYFLVICKCSTSVLCCLC